MPRPAPTAFSRQGTAALYLVDPDVVRLADSLPEVRPLPSTLRLNSACCMVSRLLKATDQSRPIGHMDEGVLYRDELR
jgi:hypothetical protein